MQTNGREKNAPPPTQESWGKTQGKRGKGTPPTQRKETPRGKRGEKTRPGEPHQPREKRKSATRRRKRKAKNVPKSLGGSTCLSDSSKMKCEPILQRPRWVEPVVNNKNKNKNKNNTPDLLSSVCPPNPRRPKINSRWDDAPPPKDPKTEKTENRKGPKLKGQPNQDKSPKATDHFKFPKQAFQNPNKRTNTKTAQL